MTASKIIFAGSGEFGLPTLRALADAGHDLVQVVSQPDRPAGRGRTLTPTPIAAFAESRKLPVLKTANLNAEPLPAADVMVVIAFGQKIAPHIVNHPRLGSVNLHASILPKCRGAAPINWAIIRGETIAGNSVIRLAERMDAGAVLGQSSLPIGELETAGELHDRLAVDGAPLVLNALSQLAEKTAVETPQDESLATIAPKLTRQHAALDFHRPAEELARLVRGMYPWPGCQIELVDDAAKPQAVVTLARARGVAAPHDVEPGMTYPDGIGAGGRTLLQVVELKPQGKAAMPLQAFQNGHRWAGLRARANQSQH